MKGELECQQWTQGILIQLSSSCSEVGGGYQTKGVWQPTLQLTEYLDHGNLHFSWANLFMSETDGCKMLTLTCFRIKGFPYLTTHWKPLRI